MTIPAPDRRKRWKTRALTGVLLLTSLSITAVMAEVAVRVAAPQQLIQIRPDLWQPVDTVGWLRHANVDGEINTGERTVRLITDHEGFRVGARGRTEGVPVLLLGDSFMEALQVEHEQSLAGLLEGSLSAVAGTSVAVRNAGISGWGPGQYLHRARVLLAHDAYPLVIIAVYTGNDAQEEPVHYLPPRPITKRHRFRVPAAISKAELIDAVLYPINDALEVRSHLFVLMRSQASTLRMKLGISPLYLPTEILRTEAEAGRWPATGDVCAEIAAVAAQHGARALFVLIPAEYQVDPVKFAQYVQGFGIDSASVDLEQPNRRLHEELAARGLDVVDALPGFLQRQQAGELLYGSVDQHLSPVGHQVLSEIVTPAAARLLSAPLTPPTGSPMLDRDRPGDQLNN